MKNVIGTPARGESFFPRNLEVQEILSHLGNGNNLQVAAPRRIGKTSILFHLLDNRLENYVYVYVDTEAIDEENDFFKKLLKEILKVDLIRKSGRLKKLFEEGHKILKRVKSISVLGQEVEFSEGEGVDYKEELINLLAGLELENNARLVILLDEFPQTVQNIIDRNKGDHLVAQRFLKSNRELRLHPDILPKVSFIITGSVGLNHTVAAIDSSAFVNDLASVEVGPLPSNEARWFLNGLLVAKGLTITDNAADYLFGRIEWLIPFHIQLAVQELASLSKIHGFDEVEAVWVDKAFFNIVRVRNNNHFEHYYSRLKKQFKGEALNYVLEALDVLARNGTITKNELFDISAKYHLQSQWRLIAEVLMYDGYINNVGNHSVYRFNSPIVRMWWQRFICK